MELTRNPILSLAAQIVSAHIGNHATAADSLPSLIRDVYRTLSEVGHNGDAAVPAVRLRAPAPQAEMTEVEDHDEHEDHDHHHEDHDHDEEPAPRRKSAQKPASGSGQTVFEDHLVCLDCGLSMKMLKRHLITVHAVTPEEYREKWGLPDDYPMVASNYAALRSSLAKQSGLGKRPEVKSKVPHHRIVAARGRR